MRFQQEPSTECLFAHITLVRLFVYWFMLLVFVTSYEDHMTILTRKNAVFLFNGMKRFHVSLQRSGRRQVFPTLSTIVFLDGGFAVALLNQVILYGLQGMLRLKCESLKPTSSLPSTVCHRCRCNRHRCACTHRMSEMKFESH